MQKMHLQILIAEHDQDDQNCLQEAFQLINEPVLLRIYSSASRLIHELNKRVFNWDLPSLILIDHDLYGISGEEALFRIKKDRALRHIPVVVYSLEMTRDLEKKLLAQGADYCFKKPLDAHQSQWLAQTLVRLGKSLNDMEQEAA